MERGQYTDESAHNVVIAVWPVPYPSWAMTNTNSLIWNLWSMPVYADRAELKTKRWHTVLWGIESIFIYSYVRDIPNNDSGKEVAQRGWYPQRCWRGRAADHCNDKMGKAGEQGLNTAYCPPGAVEPCRSWRLNRDRVRSPEVMEREEGARNCRMLTRSCNTLPQSTGLRLAFST